MMLTASNVFSDPQGVSKRERAITSRRDLTLQSAVKNVKNELNPIEYSQNDQKTMRYTTNSVNQC